jgi:hypothetical protein
VSMVLDRTKKALRISKRSKVRLRDAE